MPGSSYLPAKPPSAQKPGEDFLFVNNVRFLSMAAVVAIHCFDYTARMTGADPSSLFARAAVQPFKFGTIAFFLISGFLMGDGLTRRKSSEYLARRFRTVFLPWSLWFSLFCCLDLLLHLVVGTFDSRSVAGILFSILGVIRVGIFDSIYWFVPNLMLSLCILLLCRRFLDDLRFGAALLVISLLYGVNVHTGWAPLSSHSEALFGFIFYQWLGVWAARNHSQVNDWISRVRTSHFIGLAVLAGSAALFESSILVAARVSRDTMDTLRIANQLYSIAIVLAIVKIRKPASPHFVNVRTGTFGIYLIHPIVEALIWRFAKRVLPVGVISAAANSSTLLLCVSFVLFIIVYAAALGLTTYLISKPRLRWVVGNFADSRAMASNRNSESRFQLETAG